MGCGASAGQEDDRASEPVAQPKAKLANASQAEAKLDVPKSTAGYPSEAAAIAPLAATEQPRTKLTADSASSTTEVVVKPPSCIPSKPCLCAYAFAGRAELARLIAAVGGLDIDEQTEVEETIHFGSPGPSVCLTHGSLKIAQSFAIESYLAGIAPGFKDLTPRHRATDAMFCKIKEDMIAVCIAQVSAMIVGETQKTIAAENIRELGDKWFPVIEGMLPTTGFVNGFDFPTAADLAVLNVARGFMPFGIAYTMAVYDLSAKFPSLYAHVESVAAHAAVKAFLGRSDTMDADPMGFRAGLPAGAGKAAGLQAQEGLEATSSATREEAGPRSSLAAKAEEEGERSEAKV